MQKAREAVCRYYQKKGIALDPHQVFLTTGTSEAYSFLFRLLLNPNEQALFPIPSYPLFQFLADLNDVRMENYPLGYHQGRWQIDTKQMADKITSESRAMVLVNPNNPTGSYIKSDEIAEINRLCKDHDLAIIADEVFLDYSFEPQDLKPSSLAANEQNLTFVLGGVSKALGLPQMKLSWIVVNGPPSKIKDAKERLEIIADTYLSVNTPVQNALPGWCDFQNRIQNQIKERTRRNRDYILKNFSTGKALQCLHAEGGWYMVLKLLKQTDDESFALQLLEEDQVYIHPGYFFDFTDGAYAVVSLIPPENIFQEGLKRLARRLA